ncbi:hypothetical protein OXYTRIMIC_778 [Oxytricha trifallax]|uniref:Uncharacterized protein n=1 Tax=Oxytricha trifallax TaxID=1172189 RepID=A0A073HXF0_9SPIT|nr:hypothetical protein OXYTRIMIC_778 [Oxytricha trifallax]
MQGLDRIRGQRQATENEVDGIHGGDKENQKKSSKKEYIRLFQTFKFCQTNRTQMSKSITIIQKLELLKALGSIASILIFYQPVREVERWVTRDERYAQNQEEQIEDTNDKQQLQISTQMIELSICLQNV